LRRDRKQEIDFNALIDAAYDYRFLLARGYSYSQALDVVAQRYMLNRYGKLLLFRCVHSITYVYETLKKITCKCVDYSSYGLLVVDFYNILLTVIALLENSDVFLCDDCLIRDLRGSKLRSGERTFLTESYNILANIFQQCNSFREIVIVGDKNVSHSLEDIKSFANMLSSRLKEAKVTCVLSTKPDATAISYAQMENSIIASTDSVIIEKSRKILPLTTLILNQIKVKPLLDFSQLFGLSCPTCLQNS